MTSFTATIAFCFYFFSELRTLEAQLKVCSLARAHKDTRALELMSCAKRNFVCAARKSSSGFHSSRK